MMHKKGSRDDTANYRAICLLCHSDKLLSIGRRGASTDGRAGRPTTGHPIWIPAGSGMQGQRMPPDGSSTWSSGKADNLSSP